MVKITSVTQLLGIKENDIVINRSMDHPERYLIKQVDEMKVVLMSPDHPMALKMFLKMNLLSENWWIEESNIIPAKSQHTL
jgi:hypothetical protein